MFIQRLFILVSFIFISATLIPSAAQSVDCGNGLEQRLSIGAHGWLNAEQAKGVRVRSVPDGEVVGALEPTDEFDVLNGPQCQDGISWWQIKTSDEITGWIAEGTNGSYFVELKPLADMTSGGGDGGNTCVKSDEEHLRGGIIAQVQAEALPVYEEPDGQIAETLTQKRFFLVLDDAQCTEAGIAWWNIQVYFGDYSTLCQRDCSVQFAGEIDYAWVPQTDLLSDRVSLRPPDNQTIQNRVVLSNNAPLVGALDTLKLDSGAGGGGDPGDFCGQKIGDWYQFGNSIEFPSDREHFKPGENVLVTIYQPDDSVFRQDALKAFQANNELTCPEGQVLLPSISFGFTSHPGKWRIEFKGEASGTFNHDFYLTRRVEPTIVPFCNDGGEELILDGFNPNETLQIEFVKPVDSGLVPGSGETGSARIIAAWSGAIDQLGQIWITFDDSVDVSGTYILIKDNKNNIWGMGSGGGAVGNIQFGDCNQRVQVIGMGGVMEPTPTGPDIHFIRPVNRKDALQYQSVWDYVEFRDTQSPSTQEYIVNKLGTDPLHLSFTWCADSTTRLQQILAPMTLVFPVQRSGELGEIILINDVILQTDIGNCRIWDTVMTSWQIGDQFTIAIKYTLSGSVFDGINVYKAGEYWHKITINVS